MSLKEEIIRVAAEEGVDIRHIEIDKDGTFHGRPGTEVAFIINGDQLFEGSITNDLGLSNERKAELLVKNAVIKYKNLASALEEEVEA